jgi:hypothetical protein
MHASHDALNALLIVVLVLQHRLSQCRPNAGRGGREGSRRSEWYGPIDVEAVLQAEFTTPKVGRCVSITYMHFADAVDAYS